MSPVQTVPKRTRRTLRRRSRTPRSANTAESEGAPLEHLKQRCIVGAGICFSAYLAVIPGPVLWPSTATLVSAIGLEVGIGIMGMLFALVAIVIWLLTESTAFVLSVSKAVSVAAAANAALEAKLLGDASPEGTPIPIQRGHELRQHRTDRHAG